ncbi:MAG: hypothetical protein NZ930_03090 [Candidatus Bipolaricaulota bacterium]|nr:hypothetical protein [Candidatus Bipolaricaulota bacterium]MDW8030728.1 hypothetical protein [Candidatus Bipolaricaulota bacterium]
MWRGCVMGLVAAAWASAFGLAQVRIEQIELGFNGRFFPGAFTPLTVTVSSTALAQHLVLEVSQEIREFTEHRVVERVRVPLSLASGTRKIISFDFPIYSVSTPAQIVLADGTRELARSTLDVRELWSETPLVLGIAVAAMPSVELIDIEKLPKRWTSYDGVGRIFWGRADPERLTVEQRQALQGWLVRGGELIVLSGENWYEQSSGWWMGLLPIANGRVIRHEFNGQEILWVEGEPRTGAQVKHWAYGRPLVWERSVGKGKVVLVAIATLPEDLKLAELSIRQTAEDDLVIVRALGAMIVPFPSRELIGVLLVLFVLGVGLSGMLIARWSKTPLGVGLLALIFSSVLLSYQRSPGFSSEKYSLDIGVIQMWSGEPVAWERAWYGVFFRHSRDEQLMTSADVVSTLRPSRQALRSETELIRELLSRGDWQLKFHGERGSVSFFRVERFLEPFVRCSFKGSRVWVSNQAPVALRDVIAYSGDMLSWLGTIPAQAEDVRPLAEHISMTEWVNALTPERRRLWQQWGSLSGKAGLIGWIEDTLISPIRRADGEQRTVLRLVLLEGE